jgi:hypothetical protein
MKFNIDLQQIRQFKIIYAWVGNEFKSSQICLLLLFSSFSDGYECIFFIYLHNKFAPAALQNARMALNCLQECPMDT